MLDNLLEITGLKTPLDGRGATGDVAAMAGQDSKGAIMLADYLKYEFYSPDSGVFYNKNSLGCFFEVEPLVGSDLALEKNLKLFFNNELPAGVQIQFLVVASNQVEDILARWQQGQKLDAAWSKEIVRYRLHMLRQLNRESFSSALDGRVVRNFRTIISCSVAGTNQGSEKKLLAFKKNLFNKLKAENLYPRAGDAAGLVSLGREILEPLPFAKKQRPPIYDPLQPLADQVAPILAPRKILEDRIIHQQSGFTTQVLAPVEVPEEFSLAQMVRLLGSDTKQIPGRFVLSYTICRASASEEGKLQTQGQRAIHAAGKSYTRHDLVAQSLGRNWVDILARRKSGELYMRESFTVSVSARDDELESSVEALKSIYNALDWKLQPAYHVQRLSQLAQLPMLASEYSDYVKFFRLSRYCLSRQVVEKLPLQGEWPGVPDTGMLLLGRQGQLMQFDPFYRLGGAGNYNVVMLGPSGSGKSFALQEMVRTHLNKDRAVFIMDIGASFKNLCGISGGELVQFNGENAISLNPFASLSGSGARYRQALNMWGRGIGREEILEKTGLTPDKLDALLAGKNTEVDDKIEIMEIKAAASSPARGEPASYFVTKDSIVYAKTILATMCGVKGQNREEAILERAVLEGVARYGETLNVTLLSDVLAALTDKSGASIDRARELADSLFPFTKSGVHGRFFDNANNISFKKILTVFELEELVNDRVLLGVVVEIILMQIISQFLCGDRKRYFSIIVDEAWMLLDYAPTLLERLVRTVRKYGGSLVICTQDLGSFDNESGLKAAQASILENSSWKMVLQQTAKGVEKFRADDAYADLAPLVETVKKSPTNKYSEILINTDGVSVVGRLVVDPYSVAAFSTEKVDFTYLEEQKRRGVPLEEALKELAQKYGGLPSAQELQEFEKAAEA